MSETKSVSRECYSKHLSRCVDELRYFKENQVPVQLKDYTCELSYYSGNVRADYYSMECKGTEMSASASAQASPVPQSTSANDTFDIDKVIYKCSVNFGSFTKYLGRILVGLQSNPDGEIEIKLDDAQDARIKKDWETCKKNAFELAATKLGPQGEFACKIQSADPAYISAKGIFLLNLTMECSRKK